MKRVVSVFVLLFLGVASHFAVYAQDSGQVVETDQSVKTGQTSSDNLTKEQRVELEKRKLEKVKRRETREAHYREDHSSENSLVSGVINSINLGFAQSSMSFTYAPGTGNDDICRGIQFLSATRVGVSFWVKGNTPANFIYDTIPHNNYTLETSHYSTGVELLVASGHKDSLLILGIGAENRTTQYVAISNDTSLRWDAGESHSYLLAASAAYRLRLFNHVSVMLGFDTSQKSYFGLTAVF